MNRTFKVVFNKARGMLTAVNEAASCVQAKGTKTVVAAAAAALLTAGAAGANTVKSGVGVSLDTDGQTLIKAESFEGAAVYEDGAIKITANGFASTSYGVFTNMSTGDQNLDAVPAHDVTVTDSSFTNNTSSNNGGGLTLWHNSDAETVIENTVSNSTFTGNSAKYMGGAVMLHSYGSYANPGETTFTHVTFDGNTAEQGGALGIENNTVLIEESKFANNGFTVKDGQETIVTKNGGAIYAFRSFGSNDQGKTSLTINNTKFTGNKAANYGGAIYVNAAKLAVSGGSFEHNETKSGGAIAISDGVGEGAVSYTHEIANAIFEGNKASNKGGAIALLNMEVKDSGYSTLNLSNVTFSNNEAKLGGAIAAESIVNVKGSTLFEGNKASENGGAIYLGVQSKDPNEHPPVLTIGSADDDSVVKFVNNTAGSQGGAIYVASTGSIVFAGSATFSGNTVGEGENVVKNDIHNLGKITVAKGASLSLDGGISGNGTISFADGSSLNVTIGTDQASSTTIANKVSIKDSANLSMTFAPGYKGKYTIFSQDGAYAEDSKSFTLVNNAVFDVTGVEGENGSYNIALKDASAIAQGTGADSNQAAAIEAIMSKAGGNESFKTVAEAISTGLQSQDAGAKQAALDAVTAMSPEAAPMVTQVSTDTAAQVFRVVGNRFGGAQGMSSGDGTSGTALWVQGMVGATDMESTGTARGYSSDSNGFALGLEAKPTQDTTLGMGFAYTNTDVDGFLRTADVDTMTAFVYGEYKPADWYVNGILSYAWSNYDEDRSVAGTAVTADYDADTFGLQVTGGHNFNVAGYAVTPEVGLRYFHLNTDGYTDSLGTSVADSDNDVLTGVAGVRFAKDFEVSPAFTVKPELRLAATYDIVDADNQSFVTLANGSSYSVDGETLDRFGFEAGVGVTAQMGDNFEMAFSYEGSWRGDFQNHAGLINAKYKF